MTAPSAQLLVDAGPPDVRAVLLDPLALPDWNPAFTSIAGPPVATVGQNYRLTVRPGLRGRFTYDLIEPTAIEMAWQVPGFAETAAWELWEQGTRTMVRHHFRHTGPLATVLGGAYRSVAELRLRRLADRLPQPRLQDDA